MRNTLPLSSFPLQILLVFQQYYQLVLSIFIFFLVLFKTYNLPYTAAMSAQQGIILFIFIIYMQIRIKYGISANRVRNKLMIDGKFNKNGAIRNNDCNWDRIWNLLRFATVLCTSSISDCLCHSDSFGRIGADSCLLCMLAISKLLKATMIFYIFQAINRH